MGRLDWLSRSGLCVRGISSHSDLHHVMLAAKSTFVPSAPEKKNIKVSIYRTEQENGFDFALLSLLF